MSEKLNFVFFGTPNFAVYVLEELAEAGYLPSLVVTTPDIKIGRGNKYDSPPVKKWADAHNIPVLQPEIIDESFLNILRKNEYDIFVLTAYGKMLPKKLLDIPKYGILNTHPSLLPKLRGASPVRSAILNNERITGATVIILDEKMDHGPIVGQESIEIKEKDWPPLLSELEETLFRKGGKLLVKVMEDYVNGKIIPKTQDESKATYSKKIRREDGLVDLEKDPTKDIYNKYCAFYGWPGIYFVKNGKRIKITDAVFENGEFVIKKVLPEGKKEIKYEDFLKN
ncbi:MAG: methionyl-tRNA formyltransferase [Patescibacteria group bacterium]